MFRTCTVTAALVALDHGPGRLVAVPRRALDDGQVDALQALVRRWSGASRAPAPGDRPF
jgi:hypothetical protein